MQQAGAEIIEKNQIVMSDQYKTTASGTGLQQENHSLFFAAIPAQYYRVEGGADS
jgi:hypothetical protein